MPIKATIAAVTPQEIMFLRDISEETFIDTFLAQNEPKNINAYVSKAFSLRRITSEYDDPNSNFFFAKYGSEIVGYMKVNTGSAQTEQAIPNAMEVERIYVRKRFQGKGIGRILLDFALSKASELSVQHVWLGVWEKNTRAIAFYSRMGFSTFGYHNFMMGDDRQRDIMMKLCIPD